MVLHWGVRVCCEKKKDDYQADEVIQSYFNLALISFPLAYTLSCHP